MIHGTAAIALAGVMGVAPVETPASEVGPVVTPPGAREGPAEALRPEPAVTPEPAEVVAPVPAPVVAPGPMPGPVVLVDIPTPQELRPAPPRWDGRGLLIAAGVMGGINIGLGAARLGLGLGRDRRGRRRRCGREGRTGAAEDRCTEDRCTEDRHDGYRTAYDLRPKNNSKAFTSSGVILLVMGAVAWACAWTPWQGDPTLDARGNGSLVVETAGSLLLMGGSGLVAYGVSWNKHATLYGRSARRVALAPMAAPGFAGLRLGGRF